MASNPPFTSTTGEAFNFSKKRNILISAINDKTCLLLTFLAVGASVAGRTMADVGVQLGQTSAVVNAGRTVTTTHI